MEEEGLDIGDDEEDHFDITGSYTLRKISLKCLIKIFEFMGNSAFSYLKSHLDKMFQSENNLIKEAAICTFGSVGAFCFDEFKSNLGQLLNFILSNCQSNDQFLR